MAGDFREVTRSNPCPVCGKPDWCARTLEGYVKCERCTTAPPGWKLVSARDGGGVFGPEDDADRRPLPARREKKPAATYATCRDAIAAVSRRRGAEPVRVWAYHDAGGDPTGAVGRWDTGDGKVCLPFARVDDDRWANKAMPEPRPLYRLPELLSSDPSEPVVVCEGEKATDVAESIGLVATTSPGGSKGADRSDWSPLKNRSVVIAGDDDDAGRSYARDVARLAAEAGARSVKVIDLAAIFPAAIRPRGEAVGGDLADVLDDGEPDHEGIRELIDAAIAAAEPVEVEVGPEPADAPKRLLNPVPLDELGEPEPPDWLWDGYAAAGYITLLVGLYKAGKSTLMAHVLRGMERGGGLVDRPIGGPVLVVSEEAAGHWKRRRDELGLGGGVHLQTHPTLARPSHDQWVGLADEIAEAVRGEPGYRCVVMDTLPGLWPAEDENSATDVLACLTPLKRITGAGAALVLLHHPRKSDNSGEFRASRGSGALPGFADVLVELRRFAPDDQADPRRVLNAVGRFTETPAESVIELRGDEYVVIGDKARVSREERLAVIDDILAPGVKLTGQQVHDRWPTEPKPGRSTIMHDLTDGAKSGRWLQSGSGRKGDPRVFSVGFDSSTKGVEAGGKESGFDSTSPRPPGGNEKCLSTSPHPLGGRNGIESPAAPDAGDDWAARRARWAEEAPEAETFEGLPV